jgi:hypothetical protein
VFGSLIHHIQVHNSIQCGTVATSAASRFVYIVIPGANKQLSLSEITVMTDDTNLFDIDASLAVQSSTYTSPINSDAMLASRALDHDTSPYSILSSISSTANVPNPAGGTWWRVQLPQKDTSIHRVKVWTRREDSESRVRDYRVWLADTPHTGTQFNPQGMRECPRTDMKWFGLYSSVDCQNQLATYVYIVIQQSNQLQLAEVQIYEKTLLTVDYCATLQPCMNQGTCIDTQVSWQCICGLSWTGITCRIPAIGNLISSVAQLSFSNYSRNSRTQLTQTLQDDAIMYDELSPQFYARYAVDQDTTSTFQGHSIAITRSVTQSSSNQHVWLQLNSREPKQQVLSVTFWSKLTGRDDILDLSLAQLWLANDRSRIAVYVGSEPLTAGQSFAVGSKKQCALATDQSQPSQTVQCNGAIGQYVYLVQTIDNLPLAIVEVTVQAMSAQIQLVLTDMNVRAQSTYQSGTDPVVGMSNAVLAFDSRTNGRISAQSLLMTNEARMNCYWAIIHDSIHQLIFDQYPIQHWFNVQHQSIKFQQKKYDTHYIADCNNTIGQSIIIVEDSNPAATNYALHIAKISIYTQDACASNPCANTQNQTCINNINSYQCLCSDGRLSRKNTDDCTYTPCENPKTYQSICENSATCSLKYGDASTPHNATDYSCDCGLNYAGRNCERYVDRFSCIGWPFGVFTKKTCDSDIEFPPQTVCDCCCSTGECLCVPDKDAISI